MRITLPGRLAHPSRSSRRARGGAGAAGRPGDRQRPPLPRPAGRTRLRAVGEGADAVPAAVLDVPCSRDDRGCGGRDRRRQGARGLGGGDRDACARDRGRGPADRCPAHRWPRSRGHADSARASHSSTVRPSARSSARTPRRSGSATAPPGRTTPSRSPGPISSRRQPSCPSRTRGSSSACSRSRSSGSTPSPTTSAGSCSAIASGRRRSALDRARLHEEQHHIAHVLQRSLLPETLPHVPGPGYRHHLPRRRRQRDGRRLLRPLPRGAGPHSRDRRCVRARRRGRGSDCALPLYAARRGASAARRRPGPLLDKLNQSIIRHSPSVEDFASATCLLLGRRRREDRSRSRPPDIRRRSSGAAGSGQKKKPQRAPDRSAQQDDYQKQCPPSRPPPCVLYTDGLPDSKTATGEPPRVPPPPPALPPRRGRRRCDRRLRAPARAAEPVDDVAVVAVATVVEHS